MPRRGSSRRWLKEHHEDAYVKEAKAQGYRARAVYKLMEIDRRDRLLARDMLVVDLGAAPGSWSQYAVQRVGPGGRVIALDILPIPPVPEVRIIEGDFREAQSLQALRDALGGSRADLVLSDMAPNISGVNAVDQPRAMYLAELALDLCREVLKPGGALVVKLFQGEGFDEYLRAARGMFARVHTRKPRASRSRSRELYLVAKGYNE